jgi:hypothetical protein
MSVFETDIVSWLATIDPITALVSDRIYGLYREPSSALPQLMIQRIATLRQPLFCRTCKLVSAEFQLDSYALTGQDAWNLAKAVRRALVDFGGQMGATLVDKVFLTNEFALVDPDPGDIRVTQLYTIWYQED